jgi:hypothetical protein
MVEHFLDGRLLSWVRSFLVHDHLPVMQARIAT